MGSLQWWMPLLALLVLVFIAVGEGRTGNAPDREHHLKHRQEHLREDKPCPCTNDLLCMPLENARRKNAEAPHVYNYLMKKNKTEVFAFVLSCNSTIWSKFDWNKLTTIAIAGDLHSDLICHAHENGVVVTTLEDFPTNELINATARASWIDQKIEHAVSNSLDGINIDYEDYFDDGAPEKDGLTALVKETADAFHKAIPGSQVSFDVAWKAGGVDGRFYDYKGIGDHSDVVFIMAYDEMSQIFDEPCNARANSGIERAVEGIQSYIELGLPPEKLVLGVPWYGYRYPCIDFDEDETCYMEKVPFRGANCSDAAGSQHPYSYMVSTRAQYNATYHWEESTKTPYYTIKDETTGQYIQMRYDNDVSLAYKYVLAVESSLRGVGMWTANFLDYSDTLEAMEQQKLMWGTLP